MEQDMTVHRKNGIQLLIVAGLVAALACSVEFSFMRIINARHAMPAQALAVKPAPDAANDGSRLAHVDGCFGCHGSELTGRVVFSGWFGTRITAPNLTRLAHQETDAQLAATIRYGVKRDGTSVIDMPSSQLIKSSDSDIAAILAYLHTLTERPDATGNTRWRFGGRAMLVMGLLPVEATTINISARGPLQTPVSPIALGRYITQSHCSGCHGPDLAGKMIEGSPDLRVSIQHYSPVAFERFFRTGEGQIGHGTKTMTRMIRSRFRYLTSADVSAVYVYLKAEGRPL